MVLHQGIRYQKQILRLRPRLLSWDTSEQCICVDTDERHDFVQLAVRFGPKVTCRWVHWQWCGIWWVRCRSYSHWTLYGQGLDWVGLRGKGATGFVGWVHTGLLWHVRSGLSWPTGLEDNDLLRSTTRRCKSSWMGIHWFDILWHVRWIQLLKVIYEQICF